MKSKFKIKGFTIIKNGEPMIGFFKSEVDAFIFCNAFNREVYKELEMLEEYLQAYLDDEDFRITDLAKSVMTIKYFDDVIIRDTFEDIEELKSDLISYCVEM